RRISCRRPGTLPPRRTRRRRRLTCRPRRLRRRLRATWRPRRPTTDRASGALLQRLAVLLSPAVCRRAAADPSARRARPPCRRPPAAEAARDTLERFPYLLSVPLAKSDEFDDGRLAEGYAILLQRLEKEEPGFVREALTRLNPQFTTRARNETYPLGQELYLYV